MLKSRADITSDGGIGSALEARVNFRRKGSSDDQEYFPSRGREKLLTRESAMKSNKKPDAGKRHVRFDERGWETGRRELAPAPILDSTCPFSSPSSSRQPISRCSSFLFRAGHSKTFTSPPQTVTQTLVCDL